MAWYMYHMVYIKAAQSGASATHYMIRSARCF